MVRTANVVVIQNFFLYRNNLRTNKFVFICLGYSGWEKLLKRCGYWIKKITGKPVVLRKARYRGLHGLNHWEGVFGWATLKLFPSAINAGKPASAAAGDCNGYSKDAITFFTLNTLYKRTPPCQLGGMFMKTFVSLNDERRPSSAACW